MNYNLIADIWDVKQQTTQNFMFPRIVSEHWKQVYKFNTSFMFHGINEETMKYFNRFVGNFNPLFLAEEIQSSSLDSIQKNVFIAEMLKKDILSIKILVETIPALEKYTGFQSIIRMKVLLNSKNISKDLGYWFEYGLGEDWGDSIHNIIRNDDYIQFIMFDISN